jgi:beta-mannosidase
MMRRTGKELIVLCCLPLLARARVFSLFDLGWALQNQNRSIVIPGSLPSQVHIDLFIAGVINDLLLGINGEVGGHSQCYLMLIQIQNIRNNGS